MRTTIDSAGRLVVPKAIRREANLEPGVQLEIRYRDGRIEIEPAPREVRIVSKGRVAVAEPLEEYGPLATAVVRKTQEKLRTSRK